MLDIGMAGKTGKAEVCVDSGAEESVCPKGWGAEFGMDTSGEKINLVNASGGRMEHYGSRVVEVYSTF